jgi:hypothetical protein
MASPPPEPAPEHQPPDLPPPTTEAEAEAAPPMSPEEQLRNSVNENLARVPGSPTLDGCAHEQQGYIMQYGMDMISHGHNPDFTAQVCAHIATLFQPNIDEISAQLTQNVRDFATIPLERCSPEQRTLRQQAYILQYGVDMIRDGNKPEFAAQVCASMAILYQNGIESVLPQEIDIKSTVSSSTDIKMRRVATKQLSDIMAANGANYKIISSYIEDQRTSSWQKGALVMKSFLMAQRQNPDDVNSIFVPKIVEKKIRSAFPGKMSPLQIAEFTKSVAMYKAFTAITLSRLNMPEFINHETLTCSLQRGLGRKGLIESYPGYPNIPIGTPFRLPKNGIADSTSLGPPPPNFTGKGSDVHQMDVAFSRILVLYFMSEEMCKGVKAHEHEITCDLSNVFATIIKHS